MQEHIPLTNSNSFASWKYNMNRLYAIISLYADDLNILNIMYVYKKKNVYLYICDDIRLIYYMYVCIYIYTRMYVYIYIHTYVCMYIYIHTYECIYIHTYVCIYMCHIHKSFWAIFIATDHAFSKLQKGFFIISAGQHRTDS